MTKRVLEANPHPMGDAALVLLLQQQFPHPLMEQSTADGIPSLWVDASHVGALLHYCKHQLQPSYAMLYDLSAIDVREGRQPPGAKKFSKIQSVSVKVTSGVGGKSGPTLDIKAGTWVRLRLGRDTPV